MDLRSESPSWDGSECGNSCDNCGLEIDRDLNAAINLEEMAVGSTVTACGEAVRPKQLVRAASMKQEFPFILTNG